MAVLTRCRGREELLQATEAGRQAFRGSSELYESFAATEKANHPHRQPPSVLPASPAAELDGIRPQRD